MKFPFKFFEDILNVVEALLDAGILGWILWMVWMTSHNKRTL